MNSAFFLSLCLSASVLLFLASPAHGQSLDTWITNEGAIFEAKVDHVTGDEVTFTLRDGKSKTLSVSKLSERSRAKLAEASKPMVGTAKSPKASTSSSPVPPPSSSSSAPLPGSATPTPSPVEVGVETIDASDGEKIKAGIGKEAAVSGTVARVATLGASGHRLIEFEGGHFDFFVPKSQIDASPDWILDDLVGKRIQVTGKIETYREKPQIRGSNPSQIKRLD